MQQPPETPSEPQASQSTQMMLWGIYAMTVFFTFHYVLPLYINSTYLSTFASEQIVSLAFTVSAVITIIAIIASSRALERYGNFYTTLVLFVLEMVALALLAFGGSFTAVLVGFLAHMVLVAVLKFNVDVFLESFSEDKHTGGIRGMYLTFGNIAFMAAPVMAGLLLGTDTFWRVYVAAMAFLFPALLILLFRFEHFHDSSYEHTTLKQGFKHVFARSNVANIFLANLWLKFFYVWMVVYTPIYLNQYLGFSFSTVGLILSIMLSAFIILELPLGRLADKRYGEKEMLIGGFVITAIFSGILSFTGSTSWLVWALLLFGTRVGAAMVEVMSESYFFKHIDSSDTSILSVFRMTRPLAYIVAPVMASAFLYAFSFQWIFIAIGVFMMAGLIFSVQIEDTR